MGYDKYGVKTYTIENLSIMRAFSMTLKNPDLTCCKKVSLRFEQNFFPLNIIFFKNKIKTQFMLILF